MSGRFTQLVFGSCWVTTLVWQSFLFAQNPTPLSNRNESTSQPPIAANISLTQPHEFEQFIRPLLETHCLECHSAQSAPPSGGLRLDSRAGWLQGGALGPAIIPGRPDESLLIEAVEQRGERLRMPPDGRLAAHEIALLRDWIRHGSPDPRNEPEGDAAQVAATEVESTSPSRADARAAIAEPLWALRPLAEVHPASPDGIDKWMTQVWQRESLRPVPLADRLTLLRRLTYDLTGLPPAPEEIDAFVTDSAADAYERLVDRLLASPRYGERWGRFWLDVARYADSNGSDENIAHGNAWRYRNYVIRAFNADKPFDRFVREQLAGDLLPVPANDEELRCDQLVATGFLCLGPKVLAEVDETKMELDIIDEQVETVGRALMALTLGCARCHDHKFDPISTRDYYAIAGIFKSTKTMEHFTKIARWNEVSLASAQEQSEHERVSQEIQCLESELEQLKATVAGNPSCDVAATPAGGSGSEILAEGRQPISSPDVLAEKQRQLEKLQRSLVALPMAMSVVDSSQPVDLPVHIRGSHLTLGELTARGLPRLLTESYDASPPLPVTHSGRFELAQWLTHECRSLTARVIVNRVWRWHFGRGLSPSTDNFGRLGEAPWHPLLLDSLAMRLIESDWSIKDLQRCIVLSQTYRRSSITDEHNLALDPADHFLWRAPLRRLEAEAVRDTLLNAGDQLSLNVETSLLHVKNREFLFDHTSRDETRYDVPCRSVYLPVIRNHLFDLFQLFDFADESVMTSDRATTTVAPQALFLLNSELSLQAARQFAVRVLRERATVAEQIEYAYRVAFGRPPTSREQRQAAAYLVAMQSQLLRNAAGGGEDSLQGAWALFCQVLLTSNELIYVR